MHPHFTIGGKKKPVSVSRLICFHYIYFSSVRMALLSTSKGKKNKRGIKVSSLSCATHSSIPVKYKILQEETEGKEEKENNPNPKMNIQQSRCLHFGRGRIGRICHQDHHLLCPLLIRISKYRCLSRESNLSENT